MTSQADGTTDDRPVCLLTGASGALGTEICQRWSDRYQIVGVWHDHAPRVPTQNQRVFDPLAPSAAQTDNGRPIHEFRADLTDSDQAERLVEHVLQRFGRVDLLINAAAYSRWLPAVDDPELITNADMSFAINVTAPLQLAVLLYRVHWAHDPAANRAANRSVINVSSTAGHYAYVGYGQGLYSASKAALGLLTAHLAAELRIAGVRVNAVAPDSFPYRVGVDLVIDRMAELAASSVSGQILLIEPAGERWLDPTVPFDRNDASLASTGVD